MQFNSYIWGIYKNSKEGKKVINNYYVENLDYFISELTEEEVTIILLIFFGENQINKIDKKYSSVYEKFNFLFDSFKNDFDSIANAEDFFINILNKGINLSGKYNLFEDPEYNYLQNIFDYIYLISVVFYIRYPEFFIPYYYVTKFNKLSSIFSLFEIPLPEIPPKKELEKRVFYYFELCKALYEFRIQNNMSPQELCAFLYNFAPKCLEENDSEMPKPSKVWFCGGGKNNNGDFEHLDEADENSVFSWQGSIDTRRGDIIVMYCLTPRSYIHSIWRAKTDGFIDPFFHYYKNIYIGNPIITVQITQKELMQNSVFAINSLVRSNMQGINGFGIKYEEYEELLRMMVAKGQDISILPRIEDTIELDGTEINNERDVEEKLVEPLLHELEYIKNKDYIRQMPLRMERNDRYYPDYAFIANTKKGDESALMILEAKETISTDKEHDAAYKQALSYAYRLRSNFIVLAAKQGIWIYGRIKNNFIFNKYEFFNWRDIYNTDNKHKVNLLIGKKAITGKKEII